MTVLPLALFFSSGLARAEGEAPGAVQVSGGVLPPAQTEPPNQADSSGQAEPVEPDEPNRALALGGALVPGALVHGTGHFVLGKSDTGSALFLVEGIGIGMVLGGGTVLVLTGASRYLVGPAAAVAALGFGLFTTSFAADLYGVLSPDPEAAARRDRRPPFVETELGLSGVDDPHFDYGTLSSQRVRMQSGPLRLEPSLVASLGGHSARYRVEAGYRLFGPRPESSADRASDHLELELGLVRHAYPKQFFTRSSVELAVEGRYDLSRLGATLGGAFVELGVGYALGRIDYGIPATPVPSDDDDLLLARFAFGAVLRGFSAPGSEAVVYYDHRHDDFAAGLLMPGLGSGVIGHFGAEFRYFVDEHWGVRGMGEVGSALVGGISLLFRQSGRAAWQAR